MSVIHSSPYPKINLPECSVWDLVWSNPHNISWDKTAIIDGPTGRTWSRKALKQAASEIAYGYRNVLQVQPGQVVLIFSPNSFYYHLFVLAAQCAGCIFSGANAAYTPEEFAHQATDSSAAVILVHPQLLDIVLQATKAMGWDEQKQKSKIVLAVRKDEAGPAASSYKTLDDLMTGKTLEPYRIQSPKDTVAFLGFSSGTSGKAKGVQTSHYNMTSVLSMLGPLDITQDDTHMAVLPLNHIYGLTKLTMWPVLQGATVVVMPKFDLEAFCQLVERYRITICMLVPPIALQLARSPIVDKYRVDSLKLIISGAAPLGPELETELQTRLRKRGANAHVAQAYGLTESSPTTHYCPIAQATPGSIGPLLPMMRGRIVDPETNRDVENGQTGELLLQGPNIMLGYLNRPEATAETLITNEDGVWLKTGDIARVDDRGFFFITDRLKELIKVKGFQVPPAELEANLLECPYVADAAVIGVWDDSQATEFPRAYVVVSDEGKRQRDPALAVREWLDGRVSNHKRLKGGVRILDAIPKLPSGKILRRVLRDEAKKEAASMEPPVKAKL